jgi:hypothetical protein
MNHLLANIKAGDLIVFNPEHEQRGHGTVLQVLADRKVEAEVGMLGDSVLSEPKVVEVNYYDIERVNGAYVFSRLHNVYGSIPEIDIVVKVGEEQQQKGIAQDKILQESLEFVARQAHSYRRQCLRNLFTQISSAVKEIRLLGEINEVFKIGTTLMEQSIDAASTRADELSKFETDMLVYHRIQHRLAKMSMGELRKVLTPEAQADILKDLDTNNNPKDEVTK